MVPSFSSLLFCGVEFRNVLFNLTHGHGDTASRKGKALYVPHWTNRSVLSFLSSGRQEMKVQAHVAT